MTDPRVPRWTIAELSSPDVGLVLPCIDGGTTIDELAELIDKRPEEVAVVLEALVRVGAVTFAAADSSAQAAQTADQEGALAMPEPVQKRVASLYERLPELDHYAILGVAATCEDKEIKRAYFVLAKELHPDRYFRKNIGSYRHKLEAIFARLTTANETLTNKARRAEYDRDLTHTLKMRSMRRLALENEANADWRAAAAIWARITVEYPDEVDPLYRAARACFLAGVEHERAMAAIMRAIELDPTRVAYRMTRVHALLADGHEEAALGDLEIAAGIEPDNQEVAALVSDIRARLEAIRGDVGPMSTDAWGP